jgi:hypothetical protein
MAWLQTVVQKAGAGLRGDADGSQGFQSKSKELGEEVGLGPE